MGNKLHTTEYGKAMTYALGCKVIWGLLPLYWQMLRPIDSWVIILYRVVLVGICCFAAAIKIYGWEGVKSPLRDKRAVLKYFIAGILITSNWSLFSSRTSSDRTASYGRNSYGSTAWFILVGC